MTTLWLKLVEEIYFNESMFLQGTEGLEYNFFTWGIVWQHDQPELAMS